MRASVLIYNPAAGKGGERALLARQVAEVFALAGESVEARPTLAPGHATELVAEILSVGGDELPDLLVLGGDGTLNEAVTGAQRCGLLQAQGPGPRFGIIPAGTANVIARDLGLPREPLAAARLLAKGGEVAFDVGTCESSAGLRPFLLAAGTGIEAETIEVVGPEAKRRLGPAAFLRAAWGLAGRRDRGLTVDALLATGQRRSAAAAGGVTCGNSRLFGGPCRLSRLAAYDDGVLELALIGSSTLPALLAFGAAALLRDAAAAPGVEVLSVTPALVEAPEPVPVHVDAELFGFTPMRLGVLRRALRLRTPARA